MEISHTQGTGESMGHKMRWTLLGAILVLKHGMVSGMKNPDSIQIDPATGNWVDGRGRVRMFHGVNIVYKEWPWLPRTDKFNVEDSLTEEDMRNLQGWGFNVIRLGVMWPGVEVGPNRINQTYLNSVGNIVEALGQHGIYTLVDLHQDLLSRHFCGEGIPEFYVEQLFKNKSSRVGRSRTFPQPVNVKLRFDSRGYPLLEDCLQKQFDSFYFAEQVGALFRELYTQGTALNDGFLRFWEAVSHHFANRSSHVLAYELLNEPSAVCLDAPSSTGCGMPPVFSNEPEEKLMAPVWRAAAKVIRRNDALRPVLYEADPFPLLFSQPFNGPVLQNETQQGLAYHIYCEPGDGKSVLAGVECWFAHHVFAAEYYDFLKKNRGVGGFMTEFGAIGDSSGELDHLNRILGWSDTQFQSWAYWQFKKYRDFTTANAAEPLYGENGKIEQAKLKVLSRTYAQAIAGEPISMSFDPSNANFELIFKATLPGEITDIYLNEALHYPEGYTVNVDSAACVQQAESANHLMLVTHTSCKDQVITLRLGAKDASLFV